MKKSSCIQRKYYSLFRQNMVSIAFYNAISTDSNNRNHFKIDQNHIELK